MRKEVLDVEAGAATTADNRTNHTLQSLGLLLAWTEEKLVMGVALAHVPFAWGVVGVHGWVKGEEIVGVLLELVLEEYFVVLSGRVQRVVLCCLQILGLEHLVVRAWVVRARKGLAVSFALRNCCAQVVGVFSKVWEETFFLIGPLEDHRKLVGVLIYFHCGLVGLGAAVDSVLFSFGLDHKEMLLSELLLGGRRHWASSVQCLFNFSIKFHVFILKYGYLVLHAVCLCLNYFDLAWVKLYKVASLLE